MPRPKPLRFRLDQTSQLRAFRNEPRIERSRLACAGGEKPHATALSKGANCIDKPVNQVAIILAPPEHHDVANLVGVFIQKLVSDDVLDCFTELRVAIVIPANLLHGLAVCETKAAGMFRSARYRVLLLRY